MSIMKNVITQCLQSLRMTHEEQAITRLTTPEEIVVVNHFILTGEIFIDLVHLQNHIIWDSSFSQ